MSWLDPWKNLFDGNTLVSTSVQALHVALMLLAGGIAIGLDRAVLSASESNRARVLNELGASHRAVLPALAIVVVTGMLLAAADLETFLASPAYWFKIGCVALLLANGRALQLAERRAQRDLPNIATHWPMIRRHAHASRALWLVTAVAGVILMNYA